MLSEENNLKNYHGQVNIEAYIKVLMLSSKKPNKSSLRMLVEKLQECFFNVFKVLVELIPLLMDISQESMKQ